MIFRQEFDKNEYFVVKYFLKSKSTLRDASWNLAIGQSVGNPNMRNQWETDELFDKHSCIILHDEESLTSLKEGIVNIAFPVINIDFKTEIDSRKNCVPNLCFLTREDNRTEKRAKQLIDYVGNLRNQASFKERNFIDNETSLELTNFIEFYEKRKQSLKNILINKLGVTVQNENEQVNGPINLANNIPQINNQENFDNDNNYVQLNLTEVNPIVDLAENNVLNNTNQIIRNPIIIGIEINGNALIIGDNNPNTTTCYKAFFEYIIENHSDRFINSEILQRYFKTDKNYPSFTHATIGYNRVREFQNFFYHDYQDSARKK